MELIRGMKEAEVGDVLAVLSTDKGSKTDIPKWIGKAGHHLSACSPATASTRSSSRRSGRSHMKRVVVLGGGVGGTLAANLIARKLKREISAGQAKVTVVDATGSHAYQPGYMYIAMGSEKPENLVRPEKSLLDGNVELVIDSVTGIDAPGGHVTLASGVTMAFDQLVIALGSRILPGRHGQLRVRGPPLLHAPRRRPGCARHSTRSRAARSSSASLASRTSARRRRSRSRSSSSPSSASAGCATRPS